MESFMLKEILEQPEVVTKILENYIKNNDILIEMPKKISRLRIIASGSSYHAASILTYLYKEYTDIDVNCNYSSEFILKPRVRYDKDTFYIFVSQSGETSDTLSAMNRVKACGIKTMAVTNVENSTLMREADYQMLVHAGKEVSIASTKAVTAQIVCLYLTLLKYMQLQGTDVSEKIAEIMNLPKTLQNFLGTREIVETAAKFLCEFPNIAVLGNKAYYTVALEGSLKIKETSYINVNACPMGEFLHGHVAVLNTKSAVVALIDEENAEINLKNLRRVNKEYTTTIVTVSENDIDEFDFNLRIEKTPVINKLFILLVLLQLLAYNIANALGRDIDNPKGLSKVVLE